MKMKTVLMIMVLYAGPIFPAYSQSLLEEPLLVPEPRHVFMERSVLFIGPEAPIYILLPVKAGETARHAAALLKNDIAKRFGKEASIISVEKEDNEAWTIVMELNGIIENIPEKSVNAFHIRMDDENKQILIEANDANGLIYGQNILFQLMQKRGEVIQLPGCTIYDWPAIKLRGRNLSRYEHFAEPGILDLHLRAGMNYIDLRKGSFGTTDLAEMYPEIAKQVVDGAHLRGMFVWGTVGVQLEDESEAEVQRVLNMMRVKYYDYKVDGLWASYDDPGSGVSPTYFLKSFIELCDSIGLSNEEIALLPHDPGYKKPDHEFNLDILKEVPRTKEICWVFTCNPSFEILQRCQDMGLEKKPMYWWNWPRTEATFTRAKHYDKDDTIKVSPNYMPVTRLDEGWPWGYGPNPDFESMAMKDAPGYIRAAMFWGHIDQVEYLVLNYGSWAWNPENYRYTDTRRYIYEYVFGRERAHHAEMFEKAQGKLLGLFDRSERPFKLQYKTKDARKLARTMAMHLDWLRNNPYTMLDKDRYEENYIAAMENEVEMAYDYLGMDYTPGLYADKTPIDKPYTLRWEEMPVPEGFVPHVEQNAIEAEKMDVNEAQKGNVKYFSGTQYAWYDLSQNEFLFWSPGRDAEDAQLVLSFSTEEEGTYTVEACLLKWESFGAFDIYLDNELIAEGIDLYTETPYGTPKMIKDMGKMEISDGEHELKIVLSNDQHGAGFALDYIKLIAE